jgi:VWFA-related protein
MGEIEMRSCFRFIWIALFISCGLLPSQTTATPPGSASASQQEPLVPTFHATSRLVLVDVVVTDKKGEFIQELKPGDFTVLEDGKPQRISGFSAHSSLKNAPPEPKLQLPPNQYTNFSSQPLDRPVTVVLLDMLNTDVMDQSYGRKQMIKFLEQLPSGEPVALFAMRGSLAMLQGFTESSDKLIAAAKTIQSYKSPLNTTESELEDAEYSATLAQGSVATVSNGLLNMLYNEVQFQSDQRVRITLASLSTLAHSLSGYAGRKNLIWLTGGIPFSMGPDSSKWNSQQERDYFHSLHEVQSQLAAAQIAVYPVDIRGLTMLGASISSPGDTSGAVARRHANFEDSATAMSDLAYETGGKSFYSTNDLRTAMTESLRQGSNYYTLAYVPQNRDWKGDYRKIDVKSSQPGTKLTFRRGYYAIAGKPFSGDESAKSLASAMQPTVPVFTMLLIRVQILAPDAEHKAVRVDYAVNANDVGFSDGPEQRKETKIDFMAVAWDKNHKNAGYIQNTMETSFRPEAYQQALRTGIPMHQELELKPGNYTLKLGVIDRGSQKVGTVEVPLIIPNGETAQK